MASARRTGSSCTPSQAPSDTCEQGQVIGQDPQAFTKVERDSTVILTVASGPTPITLGDYTCQVFNSDMRAHIPATGLYTYPDVSVVCGEPVFVQSDNLANPIVVVEVLSKSSERNDRTTKFLDYQSVPSLKEYLLVSQYSRSITRCTRLQGNEWRIETSEQGSIPVSSIGVEITFDEIYAGADSLPA